MGIRTEPVKQSASGQLLVPAPNLPYHHLRITLVAGSPVGKFAPHARRIRFSER